MKKRFLSAVFAICQLTGLLLLTACQDLLHLEPMEPADIKVPDLVAKMGKATDPYRRYYNCKSYMMKQTFSVMQSGAKETLSIETVLKILVASMDGVPIWVKIRISSVGIPFGTGVVFLVAQS